MYTTRPLKKIFHTLNFSINDIHAETADNAIL